MKTSRFLILTTFLALMLMTGEGCYYDAVILPGGGAVEGDVFFAADVVPIFTEDCALAGCHVSGGQSPDLSEANAYSSLINGNLVDPANPENSELYRWMSGLEALPMPPSGAHPDDAALVLAWIQQGALNN